jgi:hypothetical protein
MNFGSSHIGGLSPVEVPGIFTFDRYDQAQKRIEPILLTTVSLDDVINRLPSMLDHLELLLVESGKGFPGNSTNLLVVIG